MITKYVVSVTESTLTGGHSVQCQAELTANVDDALTPQRLNRIVTQDSTS